MIFTKAESLILNQNKGESFDMTYLFVHSINAKNSLRIINVRTYYFRFVFWFIFEVSSMFLVVIKHYPISIQASLYLIEST